MDSSMKDRNDKKAWSAYEKEGKKLMKEAAKRREAISKKHKGDKRECGMGTTPEMKEAAEVTKWFNEELKNLRKKYGIK